MTRSLQPPAPLPVGSYGVKVTAPGFQTAVYPPFRLVLNQSARVDVQLRVGQVGESVEVSSRRRFFRRKD